MAQTEKKRLAVGIDLGTTYSVIAFLDSRGQPQTILNSEGDPTTPSVVLYEDGCITVGKEAQKAAAFEPERIANFAKRDMGNQHYHREINGEKLPPEVIQAQILKKLKDDAESKIGPIDEVVITVPAYFNEPRRKATQDAGQLAGLHVLDIINEPTAAAIAHGATQGFLNEWGEAGQTERILVYDLGGGTFDVTVMEIEGNDYRTLATAGDVYLGGIDWDRTLVDMVAEKYMERYGGIDPRDHPASLQRLIRDCEDAKRALTARERTTIIFEHASEGVRIPITREDFESLTAHLMQRTMFTVKTVIREAGFTWNDITRVLLVGGSTRMPMVKEILSRESGKSVDRSLSMDEAVAHGAAVYAGILQKSEVQEGDISVKNVNSHGLGVLGTERSTGRPKNTVLIPKNTELPTTMGKRFKTAKDGQKSVLVNVIEGGDSAGRNSTPIGKCVIRGLPDGLPGGTPVDVLFTYAANGRLTVRARIPSLNREAILTMERQSGLSDEELAGWQERITGRPVAPREPTQSNSPSVAPQLAGSSERGPSPKPQAAPASPRAATQQRSATDAEQTRPAPTKLRKKRPPTPPPLPPSGGR
ncbi:MAG: Hsp70 family protein [Planctomycetota bacterium]|nr:Hsp70 family protein [Planctomycetota bacterium]